MTHRDVALGREIVARWCNLAERRLEYLTELFETGRWRRFHSEVQFLQNIQEAKAAVETWRNLLRREASLDNSTIDMSWIGCRRTTPLPRDEGFRQPVARLQPQPAPTVASHRAMFQAMFWSRWKASSFLPKRRRPRPTRRCCTKCRRRHSSSM